MIIFIVLVLVVMVMLIFCYRTSELARNVCPSFGTYSVGGEDSGVTHYVVCCGCQQSRCSG